MYRTLQKLNLIGRFGFVLLFMIAGFLPMFLSSGQANAAGEVITVGMPFTGKWAYNIPAAVPYNDNVNDSHPKAHETYGANWATDLYVSNANVADTTEVYPMITSSLGTPTLSIASVTDTSCGAGKRVVVAVKIGSTTIGKVSYEHLNTAVTTATSITNGQTSLGKTKYWGNLSCYVVDRAAGTHVHISFTNTSSYACYIDLGQPGAADISQGTAMGKLGSTGATATQQVCPAIQAQQPRMGVILGNGDFYVKEGGLAANWVFMLPNVKSAQLSGNRIGVVQTNGDFSIKEGDLYTNWTYMLPNVSKIVLSGNRLGAIETNGNFSMKEGQLGSSWIFVLPNVKSAQLSGNRIGVIETNGNFSMKEGTIGSNWISVLSGVASAQLAGTRIGVVQTNGNFSMKEGPIGSNWISVLSNVKSAQVSPNRIGVIETNGNFSMKEGPIGSNWISVLSGVADAQVTDARFGVLQTNGDFSAKEGSIYSNWVYERGGVTSSVLSTD